jgi:hypothetical protein
MRSAREQLHSPLDYVAKTPIVVVEWILEAKMQVVDAACSRNWDALGSIGLHEGPHCAHAPRRSVLAIVSAQLPGRTKPNRHGLQTVMASLIRQLAPSTVK